MLVVTTSLTLTTTAWQCARQITSYKRVDAGKLKCPVSDAHVYSYFTLNAILLKILNFTKLFVSRQ